MLKLTRYLITHSVKNVSVKNICAARSSIYFMSEGSFFPISITAWLTQKDIARNVLNSRGRPLRNSDQIMSYGIISLLIINIMTITLTGDEVSLQGWLISTFLWTSSLTVYFPRMCRIFLAGSMKPPPLGSLAGTKTLMMTRVTRKSC